MAPQSAISLADFIDKTKKGQKVPVLKKGYEYLSPEEYAEMVNASAQLIRNICKGGGIEGAVKIRGRWKIPVIPEDKK